jgi:hypothetical protein
MRDWLMVLTPVAIVIYFMLNPEQFSAFVIFRDMGKSACRAALVTKHPKRPRDFSQAAKLVIDVATGHVEDRAQPVPLTKREAAELGGKKRAETLPKHRRSEIASKAAKTRWKSDQH